MPIHLYQYKLPSRFPSCPMREGLVLRWNEGWGEIAPLPGFSRETIEEAREEILSFLFSKVEPKLPSVRFGIACAAKPFLREPLKAPLCALHRPRRGCSSLKLKLGNLSLSEAIALVQRYIGKFQLRLDFNRAWTLEQALQFASYFSVFDFEYLEEPVNNLLDLIRFSQETKFPIAIDESLQEEGFLEIPTLKAAVVKPTLLGGIPPLPSHLKIVLSSAYESSLALLQIAQLAEETSLPLGLDTFTEDLLLPPLRAEGGFLLWPGGTIDESRLCLIASVP